MTGLVVPPGCTIVFNRALRALNPAERREQQAQLARAEALRRDRPRPRADQVVARIDEAGRDVRAPRVA